LVGELARRGHEVVAATSRGASDSIANIRYVTVDLATGEGLDSAVNRVEAIVHSATDPRHTDLVDIGGLRRLDQTAPADAHLVLPSIVGCDLIPTPYYKAKTACEQEVTAAARPWAILRATQFHQLIWGWYSRPSRNPLLFVPAATRYQVLDPMEMARRLADAVDGRSQGRLDNLGGPFAYEATELARSVVTASGSGRRVIGYNRPGLVGAALRAGANLTPNRGDGETWNEFVARQIARRDTRRET
jgi:uncharacterized protein YbjT (DUF2867 family)